MKTILLVLIWAFISASLTVHADEWFCTSQASERIGNEIHACGVSIRPTETSARYVALKHTKVEFQKLCDLSSDCPGHEVIAEPKRTNAIKF